MWDLEKDLRAYTKFCLQLMQPQEEFWRLQKIFSIISQNIFFCIHHKIHIFCLYPHIHDFLSKGKNFQGISLCKQITKRWFQCFNFLSQHSLLRKDNFDQEDNRKIRKFSVNHSTNHEYHRKLWEDPQVQGKLVKMKKFPKFEDRVKLADFQLNLFSLQQAYFKLSAIIRWVNRCQFYLPVWHRHSLILMTFIFSFLV